MEFDSVWANISKMKAGLSDRYCLGIAGFKTEQIIIPSVFKYNMGCCLSWVRGSSSVVLCKMSGVKFN